MKKHLFFIGTLTNGGAERVVSILSGKMSEQGMNVEILTYYDMPVFYQIHPNVKVTCVEKETGTKGKAQNFLWVRKYFKEHADVLISFLAPFNIFALACNFGTGTPIIVADRNDPTKIPSNTFVRKVRDFLYRFADGIVIQTKKNQSYFSKQVQKKSEVIYNPINLGEKAGSALQTAKHKKIVSVGRLMQQKNQKMLLAAFKSVVGKYPDYQLVIYGEGPMREDLEAYAKELGIEKSISLPGSVADVHDRIKDAEVFVLSSDYEGMPNALIEAMCLGLPVISTKVSGATDLIKDHENGILTELDHQEELETAIIELIEHPALAEKLAKNATELNDSLELSKIMNQWIHFIKKTTAEKH